MVAPPARAQLGIPAVIAAAAAVVATINNVIGPSAQRHSGHDWLDQRRSDVSSTTSGSKLFTHFS